MLAPIPQKLLVDVHPPTELVLRLHHQMHVRVLLVGVQHHGVAVLPEILAGELPRSGQNLVRGRRRRHGQHDVVHQFRGPPRRTAVPLRPVLSGGELQVPVIDEPPLLFQASDALALVRLDLQAPSAAEVRVPFLRLWIVKTLIASRSIDKAFERSVKNKAALCAAHKLTVTEDRTGS